MQKKLLPLYVLVMLIFLSGSISAAVKPSIAVLDLNLIDVREDTGKIIRNKLEYFLYNTGKFKILERNRLELLKKEKNLSGENIESKEYAIEAGRILPAEYVVMGSITFSDKYYIHLTLVDIKSGTIIYTFDNEYDTERMIFDELEKISKGVENKIYETVPEEKNGEPVIKYFYLSVHSGYISTSRKAGELSSGGFLIDTEFGLLDIFTENLNFGISAGYNHFYTKGSINYTSIIPLIATSSYSIGSSELKLIPGFGFGSAYITIDKLNESRRAFEPCFYLFLKGDFMFTGNLGLEISAEYHSIYEPAGNIDFISYSAGLVANF